MDKTKFKFNLQRHAGDEIEETQPTDEKIEDKEGEEKQEEPKTFTQEELDDIIQKRLDRAMKKAEEEREKKVKEAEELAKLSEKERAAKELELKEKELEEERKLFQRERLELQTSKELDKLGVPISFTEYVMAEDDEKTFERIKEFNSLWETELEKRRIDSMKGTTPRNGDKGKPLTKEEFNNLTHTERSEIYKTNKALYDELTK